MAGTPEVVAVTGKRKANQALVLVALALAAAAALVLHWFPPAGHGFYPRCTLFVWTGLLCPGCGSLRALSAITHGHFAEALHANLLLTLAIPVCALLAGWRRWRHGDWAWVTSIRPHIWWLLLAIVLGYGFVRNLPWLGALQP